LRAGKLFALASVEINVDDVLIEIHGIRAIRTATGATRVELPKFRDATGQPRVAIVLPEEIYGPIGDADRTVQGGRRLLTLAVNAGP
jgi:beta-galactosidase GanA